MSSLAMKPRAACRDEHERGGEQGRAVATLDGSACERERPTTMPAGNDATSAPISAGPAPLARASAGADRAITL